MLKKSFLISFSTFIIFLTVCAHQTPSPDPQANDILPPDKIADETREAALSLPADENSDILRDGSFDFGMLLPLKLKLSLSGYDLSGQDVETTPDITDYLTDTPPRVIVIVSKIPTEKEIIPQKRKGRVIQRKSSRLKAKRFRSSDSPAVTENGRYIPAGPVAYIGRTKNDGNLEAVLSVPADGTDYELAILAEGFIPRVVQIINLSQYVTIERGMGVLKNEDSSVIYLNDKDKDGVPDIYDMFDEDNTRAFSLDPTMGQFFTIAFDDQFPGNSGLDYNDFVARYTVNQVMNADNEIIELSGYAEAIAWVTDKDHKFALSLGIPGQSAQITITYKNHKNEVQSTQTLNQSERIDFSLFEHTSTAFTRLNGGSGYHNGYTDQPRSYGHRTDFKIEFSQPIAPETVETAPYNPYLLVYQDNFDLHLLGKPLLPDTQNPGGHHSQRENNGWPRAVLVPIDWAYPKEGANITDAYPDFVDWRESRGADNQDWYLYDNAAADLVLCPFDGAQVIGSGGGTLTTKDENFTINVPDGAVNQSYVFTVVEIPYKEMPGITEYEESEPANVEYPKPIFGVYQAQPSMSFGSDVEVCSVYDSEVLQKLEIKPEELEIQLFDESKSEWISLDTTINETNHTYCADTSHFSTICAGCTKRKIETPNNNTWEYSRQSEWVVDHIVFNTIFNVAKYYLKALINVAKIVIPIGDSIFKPQVQIHIEQGLEYHPYWYIDILSDCSVNNNNNCDYSNNNFIFHIKSYDKDNKFPHRFELFLNNIRLCFKDVYANLDEVVACSEANATTFINLNLTRNVIPVGGYSTDSHINLFTADYRLRLWGETIKNEVRPTKDYEIINIRAKVSKEYEPGLFTTTYDEYKIAASKLDDDAGEPGPGAYAVFNYPVERYGEEYSKHIDKKFPPQYVQKGAIFNHIASLLNVAPASAKILMSAMVFNGSASINSRSDIKIGMNILFGAIARKRQSISLLFTEPRVDDEGNASLSLKKIKHYYNEITKNDTNKPDWYFIESAIDTARPIEHGKVILLSETTIKGYAYKWVSCVTSSNFNDDDLNKFQDMVCIYDHLPTFQKIRKLLWDCKGSMISETDSSPCDKYGPKSGFDQRHFEDETLIAGSSELIATPYEFIENPLDPPGVPIFMKKYTDIANYISVQPFGTRIGIGEPSALRINSWGYSQNYPEIMRKLLQDNDPGYIEAFIIQAQQDADENSFMSTFHEKVTVNESENTYRWESKPFWITSQAIKTYQYRWDNDFVFKWPGMNASQYAFNRKRMIRFHTKILYIEGSTPAKSLVMMGSRNAKDTDTGDIDLLIKQRIDSDGDLDIWKQYQDVINWLRYVDNDVFDFYFPYEKEIE